MISRRKWTAGLLALSLALTLILSACSGNGGDHNAASSGKGNNNGAGNDSAAANGEKLYDQNDIMNVDWYVNLSWWKYPGDYGKDKFSQYIRDHFGLNINFITPAGDGSEQMSAMIATGEIPDLITVEAWQDYKTTLAKGGYLISMNELIEKYTPDFKPYEDIFNWYSESDGKTYILPNFAYSRFAMEPGEKLEPNSGFTLRSDIYDQLGNPDISSAGKLLNVLERVKNEVKTYDGKSIIPLQLYEFTSNGNSSVNWLTEYFAIPYEDEAGNYVNRTYTPQYWEMLKFLNDAYRRGLISKDNFTDKRDQINEKIASGRVFANLTAPQDFTDSYRTLYNNDENAKYEAFALRNYQGDAPVLTDIRGFGWLATMVGKDSKAHERIAKLLAFLSSKEGQHMVHFGWEGETYTYNADGTISWTKEYEDALAKGDNSEKKWGMGFNLLMDWYSVKDLFPKPEKPVDIYLEDIKKPLIEYSYDTSAYTGKPNPDHPERDKMLETGNRLSLYWGRELPRIIMAESEDKARSIYEETLKKMNEMGRKQLDEYNNELFQNGKKALGIERSWPLYLK
ncbi:extracellular solute-binding protein [Paenibacillus sp. D2_2]|uniref:extracellular solute-binding protein n=1 Tax=Paenibacillus sp. D2_2 TaxID=3073092 RepID=UPI0028164969|nr:extracellular solute-binding protein [Paenibacillus sp. D2_2]WMT39452.1 extracellular solute-binding protein [Paenibacillus sp. D2_2]